MRVANVFVWGVIVSLAGSVACDGGNSATDAGPDRTLVEPSDVRGTLWGEVVDAATGAPLEDATIVLAAGDLATEDTTDATGAFTFLDVPAGGQVGVTITKQGYTRVTMAVAERLSEPQTAEMKKISEALRPCLQQVRVSQDDYAKTDTENIPI